LFSDRFLNGMASTEKTPLEAGWILERERAVAWLRVAFAILAIAVIQLNPSRVARFPALSVFSLGSFLIFSLVAFYFTWKHHLGSARVGVITTSLDVVWIALIVYSTGGTRTPFFFYYAFPVITASLRWGMKGSVPVAFAGAGAYVIMRLTLAAETADPIGIDTIVVRSLYLIALGCIFGYVSEFEKKQNQRLLALSKTATHVAALQERRRIMFELHDSILQSLATLILRIESCRGRLHESQTELVQELRSAEDFTRSMMKDIRVFLAGKTDHPITSGTLVEKLRDELKFLQEGLGLQVILECDLGNLDLPIETEREIYYVLREGLTNVTRHSHATHATICLRLDGNRLFGALIDDGVGFEQDQKLGKSGFGLSGMTDRIKQIGGELFIESSPGAGTKISFVVPLAV
jgi:signal transduction histidine kinase